MHMFNGLIKKIKMEFFVFKNFLKDLQALKILGALLLVKNISTEAHYPTTNGLAINAE